MARTVPTPNEVLALAAKIKDAETALAQLQQQWNELFNPRSERRHALKETVPTLMDRVLALLSSNENTTYSAFDIAARLEANRNSIGPLLSRLVSDGKIEKRGHGTYGAVSKGRGLFIGAQEESPDAA